MRVGTAVSLRSVAVVGAVAVVGLLRVAAPRVVVAEVVLLVRARLLAAGLMRWMTIFRFSEYTHERKEDLLPNSLMGKEKT